MSTLSEEQNGVGRAGIVAIVGRTNVGKSTLVNHLIGEKVSIVSDTVQTTRNLIRAILTDEETIERFRQLLQLNLANAVDESESLRSLPLPHVVVKPVVSTVGEVILDTTLETISTTLDSIDGQEAVQALADSILEAVFYGPALSELETLAKDISLQVIDHMKEVVAVKKWALPDEQEKRPSMPWESE